MTGPTALLEPSFAHLIAAIEQAAEHSEQTRRHWACSVRQIGRWLDRPAAIIPARWTAVQIPVRQLHHARIGVTAKTLANHKSNLRAALRWFAKQPDIPRYGMRLSADWAALRDRIDDHRLRARLSNLMRSGVVQSSSFKPCALPAGPARWPRRGTTKPSRLKRNQASSAGFPVCKTAYRQFCKNEKVPVPAVDLGYFYKKAAADLPAHTMLKGMTLPGTSVLLDGAGRPHSCRAATIGLGPRPQRAERLSLGCGRCRSLSPPPSPSHQVPAAMASRSRCRK